MVEELILIIEKHTGSATVMGAIVALGLIEISPLKLNPWKWVKKSLTKALTNLGSACNKEIVDSVSNLDKRLDDLETASKSNLELIADRLNGLESQVQTLSDNQVDISKKTKRRAILRFADECRIGMKHSKEMFNNILDDISDYEKMCDLTKDPNHVLEEAVRLIEKVNHECDINNNYL